MGGGFEREGDNIGAFTDENGVVDDSFLIYISNQPTMSKETKEKIEQIKSYGVLDKKLSDICVKVFKMGYGACVWDHEIGLKK